MSERGTFAVDRGIWDHPLLAGGPFTKREAWFWLVSEAAWKAHRKGARSGRATVLVPVERGQVCHSLRFMARAWQWTVKRVRTFLAGLERDGMITTQMGTALTLITVCKYDEYQFQPAPVGTQTGAQKGTQRAQTRRRK
jgi:hypothetical protein